jgi:hypothetical protein
MVSIGIKIQNRVKLRQPLVPVTGLHGLPGRSGNGTPVRPDVKPLQMT